MKRASELLLITAVIQSVTVTATSAAAIGPDDYYARRRPQADGGPLGGFDFGRGQLPTPDRTYDGVAVVRRADYHRQPQPPAVNRADSFARQQPTTSSSGWTPIVGHRPVDGRPDVTLPRSAAGGGDPKRRGHGSNYYDAHAGPDDEKRDYYATDADREYRSQRGVNAKIAVDGAADDQKTASAIDGRATADAAVVAEGEPVNVTRYPRPSHNANAIVSAETNKLLRMQSHGRPYLAADADAGAGKNERDRNVENRPRGSQNSSFGREDAAAAADGEEENERSPPRFRDADGKTNDFDGVLRTVRNGHGNATDEDCRTHSVRTHHANSSDSRPRHADRSRDHPLNASTAAGPVAQADDCERTRGPGEPNAVRWSDNGGEASVAPQNRLVEKTERRRPTSAVVANSTAVPEPPDATPAGQRRRGVHSSTTRRPTAEDANADDDNTASGYGKRDNHNGHGHKPRRRATTSKPAAVNGGPLQQRPVADRDGNTAAAGQELWGSPGGYGFGYAVMDEHAGTNFGQWERREPGRSGAVTTGQYRVRLPDGRTQTVVYTADPVTGYKASVTYEGVQRYPSRTPPRLSAVERYDSVAAETSSE